MVMVVVGWTRIELETPEGVCAEKIGDEEGISAVPVCFETDRMHNEHRKLI